MIYDGHDLNVHYCKMNFLTIVPDCISIELRLKFSEYLRSSLFVVRVSDECLLATPGSFKTLNERKKVLIKTTINEEKNAFDNLYVELLANIDFISIELIVYTCFSSF